MLNVQMKGAAIFEFHRQKAEKLKQPTTTIWVRLRAPPPGTGSVQIFTNHYNMRPDGTFEGPATIFLDILAAIRTRGGGERKIRRLGLKDAF